MNFYLFIRDFVITYSFYSTDVCPKKKYPSVV